MTMARKIGPYPGLWSSERGPASEQKQGDETRGGGGGDRQSECFKWKLYNAKRIYFSELTFFKLKEKI